jgi:hypothetical protein
LFRGERTNSGLDFLNRVHAGTLLQRSHPDKSSLSGLNVGLEHEPALRKQPWPRKPVAGMRKSVRTAHRPARRHADLEVI